MGPRLFLAGVALSAAACTCDPEIPETTNRNGISEGHMPPELPPVTRPSNTATGSAAAGATAAPAATQGTGSAATEPKLSWTLPDGWHFLGAPSYGPTKGHFYALEAHDASGATEHVDVYVARLPPLSDADQAGNKWLDAIVAQERSVFPKIERTEVTSKVVGGKTVTFVEVSGTRRELADVNKTVEVPGRMQITALYPHAGSPYRIAIDGRKDLVERARTSFEAFVDSLRFDPP